MANKLVDTTAYTKMCRELGKLSGVGFAQALRAETGKVLQKTMQLTPVAKAALIRKRYANRKFITLNGKLYCLANAFPDELWEAITTIKKEGLTKALKARGLSRQSWWLLGQAMESGSFDAPDFVKAAIASTGYTYTGNVELREEGSGKRLVLTFVNSQPTVYATGGEHKLQAAISGRVKFFEKNISTHVFERAANAAKKYPGIYVKR